MKRNLFLLIAVLTIGLFTSCPTPGATLEQVKREYVVKTLSTTEGQQIKQAVTKYSTQYGVDPYLVHAVIMVESGYRPYAKSSCGAAGLMQLMPTTFRARNVGTNIYSIDHNLHAGIKHIAGLQGRYKGNVYLALAAYNAGGGAVPTTSTQVPKHLRGYVNRVMYYRNNVMNGITL